MQDTKTKKSAISKIVLYLLLYDECTFSGSVIVLIWVGIVWD